MSQVPVLFSQGGLLVVDKPPGVLSTGRTMEEPGNVQHMLMEEMRRRVWAIHQLDWETSGVNLFVTKKSLVPVWAEHLKAGQKDYIALCAGTPSWDTLEVTSRLGWHKDLGRHGPCASGKLALSHIKRLAVHPHLPYTLLQVSIATGRTHQVRVHTSEAGFPLLGDTRYGAPPTPAVRVMLHAWRIQAGGQTWVAPLPRDMEAVWQGPLPPL